MLKHSPSLRSPSTTYRGTQAASLQIDDDSAAVVRSLPVHPISRMQGAFNESIMESDKPGSSVTDNQLLHKVDAEARRQQLLELEDFSDEYSSRWRHKPGAKFHPLWKLIAQISFGVHLLQQSLAKSDDEVLRILQVHVDEVDGFLEDTTADFDLAVRDVEERVKFLRLPLEYGETFNTMLSDKGFRNTIVQGNDVIDRIIDRTTQAMDHSLLDVNKGIDATAELAKFLERLGSDWTKDNERLLDIYNTMRGNAEGWYRAFTTLQNKGAELEKLLTQLGVLATEMARRAGNASRRSTKSQRHSRSGSKATSSKVSPPMSLTSHKSRRVQANDLDKPLPPDPLQRLTSSVITPNADETEMESTAMFPAELEAYNSQGTSAADRMLNRVQHTPTAHSIDLSSYSTSKICSLQHRESAKTPRSSQPVIESTTEILSAFSPLEYNLENGPVELPAGSVPLEFSNSATSKDHTEPLYRPRTTSPRPTCKPCAGLEDSSDGQTAAVGLESAYSSDLEPIENLGFQRRHSTNDISSRSCNAPLHTAITALPPLQNADLPGPSKWLLPGKKSLVSMRGIFNKRKSIKKAPVALLV